MTQLLKYLIILCCFSFAINSSVAQSGNSNNATYIKAGKLFDSENEKILSDYIIKIERNRITEVGSDISIPANGNQLKAQATGQEEYDFSPKSENVFYAKE